MSMILEHPNHFWYSWTVTTRYEKQPPNVFLFFVFFQYGYSMSCPLPWRNFKFVTDLTNDISRLALNCSSGSSTGSTCSSQQPVDELTLWERKIASLPDEGDEGYIFEVAPHTHKHTHDSFRKKCLFMHRSIWIIHPTSMISTTPTH